MYPFVHLHVHSQYSILDGQASIPALVDKAIKDGMKGIAVTDHGNMFGIKEFFNYTNKKNGAVNDEIKSLKKKLSEFEKEGNPPLEEISKIKDEISQAQQKLFKPIFGCEVYVARRGRKSKNGKEDQSGHHLILLAKNNKGYHNLIKLVSMGWVEGYYYRPRIDKEILEQYSEGLIVSSACLGGEIPKLIHSGQIERAKDTIKWFKNIWGDDYYLEIQRHKTNNPNANREVYPIQEEVNKVIVELSKELNVKLICTNDVHFVNEEHAEAHDRLICLNTGKDLNDPNRMRYTKQEWMKTTEEMNNLFGDIPEALTNTVEIVDKVEFYTIDHGPILPNFPLPEGFENDDDYLKYLAYEGSKERWGEMTPEQKDRLDFELATIKHMGFPGYFLIVQDFIAAARKMGVSVGPGRGSAAGSVVAYCLKITDIDPIKYDLLFERFLNPDRISLPDIDIDFDDDGRGEVLRWVTEKYGHEKVAHIITYGTMATKLAIKDVARVQKLPLSESDRLTKLIPDRLPEVNGKSLKINLKNCIENVPELQMAVNSPNQLVSDTMKYAQMLEGNVRNTGVHACGIIIGRDDITDWVPVSTADDKETGEKMLVTQYEGCVIEDTGLIKMDFLGLKTLSIIKEALENIKLSRGIDLDISKISIEDPATYKLYGDGRTTGTFQFESAGMQKYLRELQPSTFEDLIAMNALYRPGPMDYIPQFIARKHGAEPIVYDIPVMEKYLKDTYGITVYQEQVMLLSRLLADFTRGESDALRKAMGKKLREKLDHMKPKFIEGGKKNGHDPKILEKIWGDWEKFASYAFNKSHATCYSWVAYQTAYLKANFPAEYMASVLSRNLSNITELVKYMDECKMMKIQVLGPDVNESNVKFTVNHDGNIRFGMAAIKGVGENAVINIINERKENGPFTGIYDFIERVNLGAVNKKSIEALALAGAFDNFKEIKREQFFEQSNKGETFLEVLVRYGNKFQADKNISVNSLFGGTEAFEVARPALPEYVAWGDLERLNKEKEYVGIYLSAHPLDEFKTALDYGCNTQLAEFAAPENLYNREIRMGGIVTNFREGITRTGNPYGIMKLEDYSGSFEIPLFGNDFVEFRKYGYNGMYLFIQGKYTPKRFKKEELEFKIGTIELLPDVKDRLIESITIGIPLQEVHKVMVETIDEIITSDKDSKAELFFEIFDPETNYRVNLFSRSKKVTVNKKLIYFLQENDHLYYKINGMEPKN
ncbi:MAG: DNA polymerase III subunit alpha [Bacteroidales bacterium]|nr:DNA polymerase III subunit alpha [Bacteroidales bacterium]